MFMFGGSSSSEQNICNRLCVRLFFSLVADRVSLPLCCSVFRTDTPRSPAEGPAPPTLARAMASSAGDGAAEAMGQRSGGVAAVGPDQNDISTTAQLRPGGEGFIPDPNGQRQRHGYR